MVYNFYNHLNVDLSKKAKFIGFKNSKKTKKAKKSIKKRGKR